MFSRSSTKEPYLLLFDVGAASACVSIARKDARGVTILWCSRADFAYTTYEDYERYERSMYATLLELGMSAMSAGVTAARAKDSAFGPQTMRVACVFGPPWFIGAVVETTKQAQKPFKADAELQEALLEEAVVHARALPEVQSWHEVVGGSSVLERAREEVLVHGYRIAGSTPVTGNDVALRAYVSFVGEAVLAHVREILERILPHREAHLYSSTALFRTAYRATLDRAEHDALFVEVGGHVTSVVQIRDGVLRAVRTIPTGTNELLQAAAPEAKSAEEARGALFVVTKHADTEKTAIPEKVVTALTAWVDAVHEAMRIVGEGIAPLAPVYLLVGTKWHPLLLPALEAPWLMPGIREERAHPVLPLTALLEPTLPVLRGAPGKEQAPADTRAFVFSHAFFADKP